MQTKVSIRLDDELHREARRLARESRRTLSAVIEDALWEMLRGQESRSGRQRITLPTFGGDGVLPGVDLSNSASLLDIMEGRDGGH